MGLTRPLTLYLLELAGRDAESMSNAGIVLPVSVNVTMRNLRLPVAEFKIDRSFVGQMDADAGSAAIVRATIELGSSLGLDIVAERVEDERTWHALKRLGCSQAQGFFIGRPMPVAEPNGWLRDWSSRSTRSVAA